MKSYLNFKKICLYLFIFMNLLCILSFHTVAMTKEEGIIKTIKSTDAVVEEVNINAYVNMDKVFTNGSKAKKISLDLAEKLGVKKEKIEDTSTKENIQICLVGKGKDEETICIIIQSTEYEELEETNIVVDVIDHELDHLNDLSKKIEEALTDFGKPHLTSCITASYKGELTQVQKENIIEDIEKNMDAKEVESFRDEAMISITSFSSKIKNYTSYGGKKVNLHIALRYNSYEDKTNLWIGTPFISIGY
ncbi:YwmB family TATA-box binding protein [Crassaminicella profunda]|uniref:YwmB family TATA-box binding protein n=1 Tax=Crassaminicella profunda TaxID=1286698 RepID=UPI001CA771F4|nr:YwmB family TATA-box binding protein [Crassaminicella profunda]QZY55530.1 YwmB family TATA-box binding protein [Crassaminicella profunda]